MTPPWNCCHTVNHQLSTVFTPFIFHHHDVSTPHINDTTIAEEDIKLKNEFTHQITKTIKQVISKYISLHASCIARPWWRHQMETFSALLAICAGNSPVPGEFPAQRPVTRSFDVFFDLRLNKRLSKQPWGWWFETPAWSLWRHRNAFRQHSDYYIDTPVFRSVMKTCQTTISHI